MMDNNKKSYVDWSNSVRLIHSFRFTSLQYYETCFTQRHLSNLPNLCVYSL